MLVFSFHYCNDNISIYKNDLKELKVNTVIIQKKYNNKIYDLKVSVGESFLGKISSLSIEVLGNDRSLEKVISINKEKIKANLLKIISAKGGPQKPVLSLGGCFSNCTAKWDCYNKPTEAGTALCTLDCALECSGA
ncbi:hypothetical protein AB4Y90_13405 [Chryseobacterium sp. 2TAF14]|uniref:hypothetical protein n=1 Tax=Chryseobacterium sp. 2TAF14 TaxID=3233007 RepID=UPI003F90F7F2